MKTLLAAALSLLAFVPLSARAQADPAQRVLLPHEAELQVTWQAATTESLKPIESALRANATLPWAILETDGYFDFPRPLAITFAETGQVNAWYSPGEHSVTMSYDLTAYFHRMFLALGEPPQAAMESAVQATIWVFFHELGHALIGEMKLPTTGKEEDAADDFATIICTLVLPKDEVGPAKAAARWFAASGSSVQDASKLLFWDEHSLDMQRAYGILANLFAAEPKKFRFLEREVPAERLQAAQMRWPRKSRHWSRLFAPWLEERFGGQPSQRESVILPESGRPVDNGTLRMVFGQTSDPRAAGFAAATGLAGPLARFAADLDKGLILPNDVTVQIADATPGHPIHDHYKHVATLDVRELMAMGDKLFASLPTEEATQVFMNAFLFRVLETTCHALVAEMQIPYTGELEDAALEMVMIMLAGNPLGRDMALGAARWFQIASADQADATRLAYWGAGSLDQQRFSDLLCYLYAADPESYSVAAAVVPAKRLARCERELPQKIANWDRLMGAWARTGTAP